MEFQIWCKCAGRGCPICLWQQLLRECDELQQFGKDVVHKIFLQDQVIVENIEPRFTPSLRDELALKSDAIQIAFRRKRQEWINRGWAIDLERLAKEGKRKALKIPCPARRSEPKSRWTFDTVPTVEPKVRAKEVKTIDGPLTDRENDVLIQATETAEA